MRIIIDIDGTEVKGVQVLTEEEKTETEKKEVVDCSEYARFFDYSCMGWTKDSEFNLAFLMQRQRNCNDMLRCRGHLFLNEVYDLLGIPRTKAGAVVGWIYDEGKSVDFGLDNPRCSDFINGYKNVVLLDFNVDGNILDRI